MLVLLPTKLALKFFRERFPRLVSSLPIMAKLLDSSAPLDKWTPAQRLVERTGYSSGSTEVSTYIELEDKLGKIEGVISKDGEAHDRVQSLLLFLDDRARRRVSAPAGSASSSPPSSAGGSSYSTGSELAELLASPNGMGPNELVDRLRSASAHVETDASGLPFCFQKNSGIGAHHRFGCVMRDRLVLDGIDGLRNARHGS